MQLSFSLPTGVVIVLVFFPLIFIVLAEQDNEDL